MTITANLIIKNGSLAAQTESLFSVQEARELKLSEHQLTNERLQELTFMVAKEPTRLIAHIQRIYFCFQKDLPEQLYAALVDLLIVLHKQGTAISVRMISGVKSKLHPEKLTILSNYLRNPNADSSLLTGNSHSLFCKGLIGTNQLISKRANLLIEDVDVLTVVRDFITYNQLDQAQELLEQSLLTHPTRTDIQQELLELYYSLDNATDFKRMVAKLNEIGFEFPDEWHQLNRYFEGTNGHD